MMEEEGMVIVGLLVGLNVLDANLCLKGEDLDSQVGWESWLLVEFLLWAWDFTQVCVCVANLLGGRWQRVFAPGLCRVLC